MLQYKPTMKKGTSQPCINEVHFRSGVSHAKLLLAPWVTFSTELACASTPHRLERDSIPRAFVSQLKLHRPVSLVTAGLADKTLFLYAYLGAEEG